MQTETESFILGKDALLEDAIRTMQEKLAALGFHIKETSWLNPVEQIWSVHIHDRDCPLLLANGNGTSQPAARASALGEYFERLSCHYFWTPFYLGETRAHLPVVHSPQERWFAPTADSSLPDGLLNPELLAFYNLQDALAGEILVDLNSGNPERGICALPYTRLSDNESTWIPVNVINNLYGSNGMSAGNTRLEARSQALSEILARYIKLRIIAEGICLPEVPEEIINHFPGIAAGVKALRAAGFSILVKDASLGGRYPVMNVSLLLPEDQGCYACFGAHPRFEVALERALTRLLQGRALNTRASVPAPGIEEVAGASKLELHFTDSSDTISGNFLQDQADFAFSDWRFSSTAEDDQRLIDCIHAEGKQIYVSDFTELDIYSCRILVPGMSEINPIDDLEWKNNSVGNEIRPAILKLNQLDDTECADLLDTLQTIGLTNDGPVWKIIGLAAAAGSVWKSLQMGELKTLLALAVGDKNATLEGCDWVHHFGQIDESRARVYRCVESLINLHKTEMFHHSLELMYGTETLYLAMDLIKRKQRFFGLEELGADMSGSPIHTRLLEAYDKLQLNAAK